MTKRAAIDRTEAAQMISEATAPKPVPDRLVLTELDADPVAPESNQAVIYLKDNAGKTQLCARFHTGAVQQIAIEP